LRSSEEISVRERLRLVEPPASGSEWLDIDGDGVEDPHDGEDGWCWFTKDMMIRLKQ